MNNIVSLESLASALIGAGLAKLDANLDIALVLVGVGVVLHVLKAVLNAKGVPVSARRGK